MERRAAIATLLSLGLTVATTPRLIYAEEEIKEAETSPPFEQTSLIPFSSLENLPDSPLEAAQKLVLERGPIYYPEAPIKHPLRSFIQAEVAVRIEDIALRYNEDPEKLKRIAWCESQHYPNSVRSGGRIDNPSGTWQYLEGTFKRFLGIDVDYRRDLDVETLLFIYSYRLSPREWSCY